MFPVSFDLDPLFISFVLGSPGENSDANIGVEVEKERAGVRKCLNM